MKTETFDLFYECSGVCTDTRSISKDCLFVCLKGDKFDANTFALDALKLGAKYVIVDNPDYELDSRIVLVNDSLTYLQKLANYHRNKFDIPVIGITGSNGKTTSKELINAVLSTKYNTLATIGNLNNHIGVPLTLLRLNRNHEIAIIEMGANKPYDIKELCDIAQPNLGIITNIGKAHLEGFGSFDGVLKTKKELFDAVNEANGLIVYNNDDEVLSKNLPNAINRKSYGSAASDYVSGKLIELNPFARLIWSHESYISPMIETKMIGKYNFYNFLAAITFGVYFNINPEKINEAISKYEPTNKRSQVVKTAHNTLILDCYNANPTSMKSAVDSFSLIAHSNKLAIIGDMLELGSESVLEHKKVLELLKELGIPTITVGPIFQNLPANDTLQCARNVDELAQFIELNPIKDTLILIKGSRGIGLEALEKVL
jgi:UDP-N-acetylmuramoyl-tripeptide--D-alanyl-D-alanine ligase